jgi:hypothetical protein
LPIQSANALDQQQVRVWPARARFKLRAGLRSHARRNDNIDQRVTLCNDMVGLLSVIRAIGSGLSNFLFDLVKQWSHLGRVIFVLLCQNGGPSAFSAK